MGGGAGVGAWGVGLGWEHGGGSMGGGAGVGGSMGGGSVGVDGARRWGWFPSLSVSPPRRKNVHGAIANMSMSGLHLCCHHRSCNGTCDMCYFYLVVILPNPCQSIIWWLTITVYC